MMRWRLQFPVTRYVLASALMAFIQAITEAPPEVETVAVGGYL